MSSMKSCPQRIQGEDTDNGNVANERRILRFKVYRQQRPIDVAGLLQVVFPDPYL